MLLQHLATLPLVEFGFLLPSSQASQASQGMFGSRVISWCARDRLGQPEYADADDLAALAIDPAGEDPQGWLQIDA